MSNRRSKSPTKVAETPVEKNGWTLYAHPALLEQIDRLEGAVAVDPSSGAGKVLTWLLRALFDEIPQDPARAEYRLGGALGGTTHWFRDKYAGRFRLFFRFSSRAKVIIFGWVNDEQTLRTYGVKTDAYAVFKKRLSDGNPPDKWEELFEQASDPSAIKALNGRVR